MKTPRKSNQILPSAVITNRIQRLENVVSAFSISHLLLNIFKFYLLGLVIAFFMCLVIGAFWLGWRALRRADKTVKERQGALYDAIMMSMVSIPVLAFAFMAILIVLNA